MNYYKNRFITITTHNACVLGLGVGDNVVGTGVGDGANEIKQHTNIAKNVSIRIPKTNNKKINVIKRDLLGPGVGDGVGGTGVGSGALIH